MRWEREAERKKDVRNIKHESTWLERSDEIMKRMEGVLDDPGKLMRWERDDKK